MLWASEQHQSEFVQGQAPTQGQLQAFLDLHGDSSSTHLVKVLSLGFWTS